MASSTGSSTAVDDEGRQPYGRYQAAESDAKCREIALEDEEIFFPVPPRAARDLRPAR